MLLLACARDACDAMCDAALARFDACLDERGLSWGPMVGYESPEDYANWCSTWAWEQRELGMTETCSDKLPIFEEGTCDDYYAAWAPS